MGKPHESRIQSLKFLGKPLESWVPSIQNSVMFSYVKSNKDELYARMPARRGTTFVSLTRTVDP